MKVRAEAIVKIRAEAIVKVRAEAIGRSGSKRALYIHFNLKANQIYVRGKNDNVSGDGV